MVKIGDSLRCRGAFADDTDIAHVFAASERDVGVKKLRGLAAVAQNTSVGQSFLRMWIHTESTRRRRVHGEHRQAVVRQTNNADMY